MPYDDIKFMESDEICSMHINQAFEWTLVNNKLTLKVFSYNKTLRVIELNNEVTQKFVAWLFRNYQFSDETAQSAIKKEIERTKKRMVQLLADLEKPSVD